jgi:hemerythrin-like domain-containing protein
MSTEHIPAELDDSTRPRATPVGALTPQQRARGNHLVLVHDMFRRQVAAVREVRDRLKTNQADIAELRGQINALTLRQNYANFGAFCAQYCQIINIHHTIEDRHLFPALETADPQLGDVLERLSLEHVVIHELLVTLDQAALAMTDDPDRFVDVDRLVDQLERNLLSHLRYEEEQLVGPLGLYEILV